MGFVKLQKNKSYFKRFQVKFRRRRECKTDYYARVRLVAQDKDKYNAVKYRFVVRRTNTKVYCQIVYSAIEGDRVLCQAASSELQRYGLTAGLTNYSAAYCTGLLLARRLLKQLGMDKTYTGQEASGEDYNVYKEFETKVQENEDLRRPFKAYLDVGLVRTTTGNRVFGALKGAVDGGLNVPHSTKRFPGSKKGEDGNVKYNAEVHRQRIFGLHIQNWMDELKTRDVEKFNSHFKLWLEMKKKLGLDSVEQIYKKVHAEIRKSPEKPPKKAQGKFKHERQGQLVVTTKGKYLREQKLTNEQRKERVNEKILKAAQKQQ